MIITSRFNGTCKACGNSFSAGARIDWTRDTGARHETMNDCAAAQRAAAPAPAVVANGAPIAAFIAAAKNRGLKFPKARFLAPDNREMVLSLAGPTSKFPGSVQVKIAGAWIGRIEPSGAVSGPLAREAAILATLDRIAGAPAEAAKAYGMLTACCSFCGRGLTDEGSVEVGYGPICADHYGLPHTAKGTPALRRVA